MKNITGLLFIFSIIVFVSCEIDTFEVLNEQEIEAKSNQSQELLSIEEINAIIDDAFINKGSFNWNEVEDIVLWSAIFHGDKILTVGYGAKGEYFREAFSKKLNTTKNEILSQVLEIENTSLSKTLVKEHVTLNVVDIKVTSFQTISALRKRNDIRYLEPNGYSFYVLKEKVTVTQKSSSGCNFDGESLNSSDYRTIRPNSLLSWTFKKHKIDWAWKHSTGVGVTIGLIDTGVSEHQPFLGSDFNDGYSSGRTIEKFGTFIDSPWWWSDNYDGPNDKCGHGTSMASTITSPRNDNYMPVGVAYNSNLVSYRATEDVVLDDYHERNGVVEALIALGNRNDVKIISMSVGYPWSIGNIEDAIMYAYIKGKLIFAAGGTSTELTNWYPVIFPASMDETIAVTGVTDNGDYTQCDTCHTGSEIMFTIIMERDFDNIRTGTVLGYYNGDTKYVGGSSVATATTAGIAALVWSKFPDYTRSEVIKKMKSASEFYPYPDSNYGYGNINAYKAIL